MADSAGDAISGRRSSASQEPGNASGPAHPSADKSALKQTGSTAASRTRSGEESVSQVPFREELRNQPDYQYLYVQRDIAARGAKEYREGLESLRR